jgi:hypothetical protein
MGLTNHIFHHVLSHGAPADIAVADKQNFYHFKNPSCKGTICRAMLHFAHRAGTYYPKNRPKIRKCGKSRQIADVIRSKNVVEIGVFYYWCPCVTLGDLGCTLAIPKFRI